MLHGSLFLPAGSSASQDLMKSLRNTAGTAVRQFQKAPWLDLVVLTAMIYMSLIFDVVLPGTQGCSYSLWLCPGLLDDINITLTVTYDKKFLVYEFLSDDSGVIGHEGCSPM